MVKNVDEDMDYDSSDDEDDENEDEIDHPVEMRWMGSIIDENGVRKSMQARHKPIVTNVDFTNKRYNNGDVVYGTIHMNIPEEEPGMAEVDSLLSVLGVVMLHYFGIKAGLNRYGDVGKKAVNKELQQLHDMDTYELMDPH